MKNFLLTLIGVSSLSLSSNVTSLIMHNNPNLTQNLNVVSNKGLFSNSYHALDNTSWWITNQSNDDQKFYSYNLEHANYLLSDDKTYAYNLFSVDSSGILQCNTKNLSDNDKITINNTKTEIEDDKKVTVIKDGYNPLSQSVYDSQYFNGANKNWKYLQFGGIENHIDISSQVNSSRVSNYQGLSESLGLYYIAKAVRQSVNPIDENVANNLAQYFITESSLKKSLNNNELVKKIINLIVHNDNIFNFILNTPFYNNDKNYSLNFIFDNNNNLITVYYNFWDKEIQKSLNYQQKVEYNDRKDHGFSSGLNASIFDWKKYANSWSEFSKIFPTITFDPSSYIKVSGDGWNLIDVDCSNLEVETENIKLNTYYQVYLTDILSPALGPTEHIGTIILSFFISEGRFVWFFSAFYDGGSCTYLWDITFDVNLSLITFNSIMK